MPCHPGCPDPGETTDSKRTGCRGEAVGSDDGGGAAEIASKAGGASQEEERGKNPVKRWFWHLSFCRFLESLGPGRLSQREEMRHGHCHHLL